MLKIQFKAPSGAFFMAAKEAPKIDQNIQQTSFISSFLINISNS